MLSARRGKCRNDYCIVETVRPGHVKDHIDVVLGTVPVFLTLALI